jgi:hypothetical protein
MCGVRGCGTCVVYVVVARVWCTWLWHVCGVRGCGTCVVYVVVARVWCTWLWHVRCVRYNNTAKHTVNKPAVDFSHPLRLFYSARPSITVTCTLSLTHPPGRSISRHCSFQIIYEDGPENPARELFVEAKLGAGV